jgi:hypothetical protein
MKHRIQVSNETFKAIANGVINFVVSPAYDKYEIGEEIVIEDKSRSDFSINMGINYIFDEKSCCREGFVILGIKPLYNKHLHID